MKWDAMGGGSLAGVSEPKQVNKRDNGGGGQAVGGECGEDGNCVLIGDWLYMEGLVLEKVTIVAAMGVKFLTFRKGSLNMEMKITR